MDEWGYPIISTTPVAHNNVSILESARYAVRGCPRQALRIERVADPS
jgi:ferredoxin